AIEEIIQSQGTIKNACKKIVDRYNTSTYQIYESGKGMPKDCLSTSNK
ncbi:16111_t:CDS:1, partial [Acaulospora morrowiae]